MVLSAQRFLIVGGGKMGEAILAGWLSASAGPAAAVRVSSVQVVDPGADRREYLNRTHGVACVADVRDVSTRPDVVVLAVKPQAMGMVLESIATLDAFAGESGESGESGPLFVSIAAGLTTASLEAQLPVGAPLVRVMPNMPLAIGAGASGVCGGARASERQVRLVADLFGSLGKAVVVDESVMDVVCAVSGSGPAYVIAMVEALRDAGAAQGLDADLAETLALQTVLGTARLVEETSASLAATRESICSPGGTTLAALEAMNANGFSQVFKAGVDAAVQRSKELAQC